MKKSKFRFSFTFEELSVLLIALMFLRKSKMVNHLFSQSFNCTDEKEYLTDEIGKIDTLLKRLDILKIIK